MALTLTPRQYALIRCGALGMSDKQIATNLGISTHTVKVYMYGLRKRIGNFERGMLPGMALLLGLVSIADVCRPALLMLQKYVPDCDPDQWMQTGFREGAD